MTTIDKETLREALNGGRMSMLPTLNILREAARAHLEQLDAPTGDRQVALEVIDLIERTPVFGKRGGYIYRKKEGGGLEPVYQVSLSELETIRKALSAPDHAGDLVVPDGVVLVPIEPTREMWAAGADALIHLRDRINIAPDFITEPVYRAMITQCQTKKGGA